MSGADDLFSSEAPAPVRDRLARATMVLAFATPLVLLGVTCFTSVPGAVLALVGWQMADEEVARVESGALPLDRLPTARRVRAAGFSLVVLSGVLFLVQIWFFTQGWYDPVAALIGSIVAGVVDLVRGLRE
ncbi:MAG: hypothetical protein ACK4YP_28545 [Myxococcota bacterium]